MTESNHCVSNNIQDWMDGNNLCQMNRQNSKLLQMLFPHFPTFTDISDEYHRMQTMSCCHLVRCSCSLQTGRRFSDISPDEVAELLPQTLLEQLFRAAESVMNAVVISLLSRSCSCRIINEESEETRLCVPDRADTMTVKTESQSGPIHQSQPAEN